MTLCNVLAERDLRCCHLAACEGRPPEGEYIAVRVYARYLLAQIGSSSPEVGEGVLIRFMELFVSGDFLLFANAYELIPVQRGCPSFFCHVYFLLVFLDVLLLAKSCLFLNLILALQTSMLIG